MTTPPAIRLAAAGDFATIAAITNHYITTTAIHFGYEPIAADELRAAWSAPGEVHPWLVLDLAGAIVGYAKSGTWRTRAAYRWIAETGIYLAPTHTGRGLGEPLYRRLLAVMRAQGFHAAVGGIALPNPASVKLHEACGFVHTGTVARAGRKFDAWHDVGFWQVMLQPAHQVPSELLSPAAGFAASA